MQTAHVITFHKCGSNWFRRLFRDAAMTHGANITVAQPTAAEINTPVTTGSDQTLALYRTDTAETVLPGAAEGDTMILCLRDPKDVLVSQYFSWKKTHDNNDRRILAARKHLNELPLKLGQRYLVHKELLPYCKAAETWLPQVADGRVHLLKYEDLLNDFPTAMGAALEAAGLPLDADALADLEAKYSFSNITRRDPGTEDASNHYRKGVAGDWQNYFDDRLTELFDTRYGPLCDALGYEQAAHAPRQVHETEQMVVVGFPKCGTTALMQAFEADPEMNVLRNPQKGLELPWPQIRTLAPTPSPGRILAHKFTAYVYNRDALTYLRDLHPHSRIVLCIRDPRKALVSWHNMHRKIATDGKTPDHFAWQERDFYAECSLDAYYQRFARQRLRYDEHLLNLLDIVPAKQLFVLSQESMARNMDNIIATLKAAARGDFHPVPDPQDGGPVHQSYADTAAAGLPAEIDSELRGVHDRVRGIIADRDLHASL